MTARLDSANLAGRGPTGASAMRLAVETRGGPASSYRANLAYRCFPALARQRAARSRRSSSSLRVRLPTLTGRGARGEFAATAAASARPWPGATWISQRAPRVIADATGTGAAAAAEATVVRQDCGGAARPRATGRLCRRGTLGGGRAGAAEARGSGEYYSTSLTAKKALARSLHTRIALIPAPRAERGETSVQHFPDCMQLQRARERAHSESETGRGVTQP